MMKGVNGMMRKTGAGLTAASMLAAMLLGAAPAYAAGEGLDMSTAYPGVTVKAGDNVNFDLDFSCAEGESYDADLSVKSLPDNWSGYFKGGNSQITRVHVDGDATTDDKTETDFSLTVPEDAEDGTYTIELQADGGKGRKRYTGACCYRQQGGGTAEHLYFRVSGAAGCIRDDLYL